jgi:DNA-binding NarL/FixJ family response regulator
MDNAYNIVIVDDHELFRDGLKFFLTQIAGMKVIGEASNGEEFLKLVEIISPDLVFMDIDMPVMNGIKATEIAMQKKPFLRIIALTGFADEDNYYKMIRAGVMGFILKHSGKEDIEMAIHSVMKGESYFSRELLQNVVLKKNLANHHATFSHQFHITPREKEILSLICIGFSDNEIAEKLHISPKAANSHRNRLLMKTGSKNSANLVMFAIKNEIVQI